MHDKIKELKAIYEVDYTKSQLALMLAIRDVIAETNGISQQTRKNRWHNVIIKKVFRFFQTK